VSLTTRTEMRRCGKPYASRDEALNSKRGHGGGYEPQDCLCGSWHLRRIPLGARTVKPAKAAGPESFPAAACALIDARDSDDSGAVPVRLCQGCGTTRNLHRHHRRGKDAGGSGDRAHTHCACNGLTLCETCHASAHASPREAQAMGWIVSQSADEPGSVGVMRFAAAESGATQWPACDGRWLETAAEMREAAA
jgi:hypothetical protein